MPRSCAPLSSSYPRRVNWGWCTYVLIFSTFCKAGKSSVESTDGPDHPITVARLIQYKQAFPSESLQYLPVLYICPSGSHALHLETYVHGFMGVYEPQSRVNAPSDKRSSEGKEIYTRDSAARLLEVLHLASQKTVSQLCAGKNALKTYKKGRPEEIPTKEEFNSSLDL